MAEDYSMVLEKVGPRIYSGCREHCSVWPHRLFTTVEWCPTDWGQEFQIIANGLNPTLYLSFWKQSFIYK
jgi:hypothetical protein